MKQKTTTKSINDFIEEMQNNYIKEAKTKKDKKFSKSVDAILTATTIIKMKVNEFSKLEREIIENAHIAGQRNAGIDPSAHSALAYYKDVS